MLGWFLTARVAVDRAQEEARQRNVVIERLHQGEVAATRLLSSLSGMSAAQRGFILTGAEELAQRYEISYRAFTTDAAVLRALVPTDREIANDLEALTGLVAEWDRTLVAPNIAERRRRGYSAFTPGSSGAVRAAADAA